MKFLSSLIFCCILCLSIGAQEQVIDKALLYNNSELKTIMDGQTVKGYYFFYQIDKPGAKEHLYMLNVYDEKLDEVSSKGFKFTLKQRLIRIEYNGSDFCFQVFTSTGSLYEYIFMDGQLNETGRISQKVPIDVAYNITLQMRHNILVALPGAGFGVYGMNPGSKKWEFHAYNGKGEETWKQTTGNTEKWRTENIVLLRGTTKNIALYETYTKYEKKKVISKHFLRVLDDKTGQEVFKTEIVNSNKAIFNAVRNLGSGYLMTGNYTGKQSPFLKGEALMRLSDEGKIESENYISFSEAAIKMREGQESRKTFQDKRVIIQHVQLSDQSVYVIADLYGKYEAEVPGKKPGNMAVFELTQSLELHDFFLLENTGSPNTRNQFLFLQEEKESSFKIIFDRELEQNSNDIIIGWATYKRNKIKPGDVRMFPRAPRYHILPAVPGKIGIFEYYEKEKRVILKLEKFPVE